MEVKNKDDNKSTEQKYFEKKDKCKQMSRDIRRYYTEWLARMFYYKRFPERADDKQYLEKWIARFNNGNPESEMDGTSLDLYYSIMEGEAIGMNNPSPYLYLDISEEEMHE